MQSNATPFTVIGGFLGAGKTTLLNHILRHNDGVRYAVLVNDFGAINIDASLLVQHEGQTLTLSNGCICCSLADGFINTMLRLMQRRHEFDHIVVEASGVSEPQRIMDFANIDPELRADAIIVLIDAANHAKNAGEQSIASILNAQTNSANLLILNKTDLVPPQALEQLSAHLAADNPAARLLRCQQAELPLEVLLGQTPAIAPQSESPSLDTTSSEQSNSARQFCSASLTNSGAVDKTQFLEFCANLSDSILRGKGVLCFCEDASAQWVWQKVAQQEQLTQTKMESTSRDCRLILIAAQSDLQLPHNAVQLFEKIEMSAL